MSPLVTMTRPLSRGGLIAGIGGGGGGGGAAEAIEDDPPIRMSGGAVSGNGGGGGRGSSDSEELPRASRPIGGSIKPYETPPGGGSGGGGGGGGVPNPMPLDPEFTITDDM